MNIVGAGRLGKTLGRLMIQTDSAIIGGICNQHLDSAKKAADFIGGGKPYADLKGLPSANITLLAAPDDKLPEVCLDLAQFHSIKPGAVFFHCSGVLTSDILLPIKTQGGLVASIHPMRSFSDPHQSVEQYPGTYCAMEGDPDARDVLAPLFASFGSIVYPIDKHKKPLYHAAAVFASNYLVTLAHHASRCLSESGVEEHFARSLILNLIQGTVLNMEQTDSMEEALTGPIKRGDVNTLLRHLSAFTEEDRKHLYSTLGKATLALTHHELALNERIEQSLSLAKTKTD